MKKQRAFASNRIAELRQAAGLTMASLAKLAGTNPTTINKLEKGEIKLSLEWMGRLGAALDVAPADLVAPGEWDRMVRGSRAGSSLYLKEVGRRRLSDPAEMPDLLRRALYSAVEVIDKKLLPLPPDLRSGAIAYLVVRFQQFLFEAETRLVPIDEAEAELVAGAMAQMWIELRGPAEEAGSHHRAAHKSMMDRHEKEHKELMTRHMGGAEAEKMNQPAKKGDEDGGDKK